LDSTLSAIKSKDFELVQPVYEFGLKSRRKKIAYITANFWSDHWRDVVSNSTLPQKLRNLLKSQTSIEKTQKNSVTNPPLSTIQNDETGGNIKSNESLEVTPQKPVAVKSIENDVNLSNENVSSEDLFKTPKTFGTSHFLSFFFNNICAELKRKSGPLYSPSFVTPPSILKSRGRPQSKELRRTHAPKIRRVSFMFNADEDNDENENIREEDNKVEKCTAVLPVLPNDGDEIIGSSVDASPAQMMLNHTEGLMQNRSHLCAMSLRQLLDLQRKLHVIMQETTESMARFSQ
jgi:hypothetical protein